MPEGPELRWMAEFIGQHARGHVFVDITRSPVASHPRKHPPLVLPASWAEAGFVVVAAEARGKELRLRLGPAATTTTATAESDGDSLSLLFRAGMTGNFALGVPGAPPRPHALLNFLRRDGAVLSFTDMRRFGSWQVTSAWGPPSERGPDVLTEYPQFAANLAQALASSSGARGTWQAPIGELLLDQRYFNGVGNYLRAEILHRAGVHPLAPARGVLEAALAGANHDSAPDPLVPSANVLHLTRQVMLESLAILREHGFSSDDDRKSEFFEWLQCYMKLHRQVDARGRSVWFDAALPRSGGPPPSPRPQYLAAAARAAARLLPTPEAAGASETPMQKEENTPDGSTMTTQSRFFVAAALGIYTQARRRQPKKASAATAVADTATPSRYFGTRSHREPSVSTSLSSADAKDDPLLRRQPRAAKRRRTRSRHFEH